MADNPNKKKHDAKLASQQKHEVKYLADKFDLPEALVRKIIEQEGPSRSKVEAYLKKMKQNAK